MDFSTTLNSVRVMCVCCLLPLQAGALCHDNVCTTWQRLTQMIPMEIPNYPPGFLLGCHFGSQQPPRHAHNAARALWWFADSPDDARVCAGM